MDNNKNTHEKKDIAILKKKIIYYIDEIVILLFTLIGVLVSETLSKFASGKALKDNDLHFNWVTIFIGAIVAIICYGSMFTKIQYNTDQKPPLIKRMINALLQGIAWKSVISSIN